MGKRKERRLAAMSAAGRRVKLDLFAEPSGEMVNTSLHDEVGGDPDQESPEQDHHVGVPNSPSSSGKKQANPLLLLGQYSDDDTDEESSKRPKHGDDQTAPTDLDDQVRQPEDTRLGVEIDPVKDIPGDNDQQEPDQADIINALDGNDVKEIDATHEAAQFSEADPSIQVCVPEATGIQVDGDMGFGWKMVLHETSNQYYYWNTVTGETSWEIPSVLVQETQVTGHQDLSLSTAERVDPPADVLASTRLNPDSAAYAYATAVDGTSVCNPFSEHASAYGSELETLQGNGDGLHLGYDANQNLAQYSTVVGGVLYHGSSMVPDYGSSQHSATALSEQLITPLENHLMENGEYKNKHSNGPSEDCEKTDVHSSRLLKYTESLLHRLNTLDRSSHHIEGYDSIMKEIEIRQSDCKALSPYGLSLLPFWWHTETQLKQLEASIREGETSCIRSKNESENEAKVENSLSKDEPLQSSVAGSEEFEGKKASTSVENCSFIDGAPKLQSEDCSQMLDTKDVTIEGLPCGSTNKQLGREQEPNVLKVNDLSFVSNDQQLQSEPEQEVLETNLNSVPVHREENAGTHAEEDVDMDVEMEVDEETPAVQTREHSNVDCAVLAEQLDHKNSSSDCPSVSLDDSNVPPPPDEEWIPPPPPDSEPIPPPPPEEPPTPFPPPPDVDPALSSYQDQYNVGYSVQTYEYYTPVNDVANGSYYPHAEVSNITESQPLPYYEPMVASVYPDVAVDANVVEPVTYYGVSSSIGLSIPVASATESSGFYVESAPISYHYTGVAMDQSISATFGLEQGSSSLPSVNIEHSISGVTRESEKGGSLASSVESSGQVARTTSANVSTSDVLLSAAPKSQTKVVRKKKTVAAAPSLRSNKKVSSLVDKWKAAKEELHGEEDEEPLDPNEILEKKRQKEIEQWRARQIASGEAHDNANFTPLGRDWRERVKRKKAAETKLQAVQTSSDSVGVDKKQPDLVELSKQLPSGWQAYWDESTKEVYYGNSITSETTWTRPAR